MVGRDIIGMPQVTFPLLEEDESQAGHVVLSEQIRGASVQATTYPSGTFGVPIWDYLTYSVVSLGP